MAYTRVSGDVRVTGRRVVATARPRPEPGPRWSARCWASTACSVIWPGSSSCSPRTGAGASATWRPGPRSCGA